MPDLEPDDEAAQKAGDASPRQELVVGDRFQRSETGVRGSGQGEEGLRERSAEPGVPDPKGGLLAEAGRAGEGRALVQAGGSIDG